MVVGDMWVRADRVCVELDRHIHDIVAVRDGNGFTELRGWKKR